MKAALCFTGLLAVRVWFCRTRVGPSVTSPLLLGERTEAGNIVISLGSILPSPHPFLPLPLVPRNYKASNTRKVTFIIDTAIYKGPRSREIFFFFLHLWILGNKSSRKKQTDKKKHRNTLVCCACQKLKLPNCVSLRPLNSSLGLVHLFSSLAFCISVVRCT